MPDMMFILVLALLLFGPKKIPEVARKIAQFRNLGNDLKAKLQSEFEQLESETQNAVPGVSNIRDTLQPFTQLRDELKAAVSLDLEPQHLEPQHMESANLEPQKMEPQTSQPQPDPAANQKSPTNPQ